MTVCPPVNVCFNDGTGEGRYTIPGKMGLFKPTHEYLCISINLWQTTYGNGSQQIHESFLGGCFCLRAACVLSGLFSCTPPFWLKAKQLANQDPASV